MDNKYVFYGIDERLIMEQAGAIIKKNIDENFKEFNLIKFDGSSLENFQGIINACETLPFISEKKVVLISRANFLTDSKGEQNRAGYDKLFKQLLEYIDQVPDHCIFIVYMVLAGKRDKAPDRIKKLEKKAKIVKIEKATGAKLEARVMELFKTRGKSIGKIELKAFVDKMQDNNMDIINNEVEKLCSFTYGRDIKRQDISFLLSESNDDDIFDLINPLSQRKTKEALRVLDELLYKGGKINHILSMIEKQFILINKIKLAEESGRDKELTAREHKLSLFRYDIISNQARRFSKRQVQKIMDLCLESEKKMKSSPTDHKTELELLIINITALK